MADTGHRKVDWGTKLIYGVGTLAAAVKSPPLTAYLMLFYNQIVGLPALTVSTIMMIALVFDAIFDPVIGQVSDNFHSRWGRRLPFMYASALPVSILFLLLWLPPAGWSHGALAVYFSLCLIGVRFFDTFFELPHQALVPELASDYDDRTRLFTIRYLFETLGGIAAMILALNLFMKERPDGSGGLLAGEGYPGYAIFASIVMFVAILACTAGLHRRLPRAISPPKRHAGLRETLGEAAATLNSRSLAVLAATAFFLSIGSGIGNALNLYWSLYFYQLSQFQISLMVLPTIVGMMAVAATPSLCARLGKRDAAILLCWVYVIATCVPIASRLIGLVPPHSNAMLGVVMIQGAIGGPAIIMVQVVLSSMIADLVEDAEVRTGRRSEGLLLSANNLVRKGTQGLGALGAGVILTVVGFPQGAERREVPAEVLANLGLLYVTVAIALIATATACLSLYRGTRATHEANIRALSTEGLPAE